MNNDSALVSIIIPTKNSEKHMGKCLQGVFDQRLRNFEVIVVDSGSRDRTLEIIKDYSVIVKKIPSSMFSHGYARNIGAEFAKGEILIYLNSDAIPANRYWLENLIEPLKREDVAASYARQVPYPNTQPAEKYFILRTYSPIPQIHTIKDLCKKSPENIVLLSTVSAAIKREIWKNFRFHDDIIYSEDQEIAVRLLKAGYRIAYQPKAMVLHSHNYTTWEAFKRYFDSGRSMQCIHELKIFDIFNTVSYAITLTKETLRYTSAYTNKMHWNFYTLIYIMTKALGFALGITSKYLPKTLVESLSRTLSEKRV